MGNWCNHSANQRWMELGGGRRTTLTAFCLPGCPARQTYLAMISLFEEPLLPGWLYPCTLTDIRRRLDEFPPADLSELQSVGLVASTRRNNKADAIYLQQPHPRIHIYSYPASLEFKLPLNTK